MADTKTYNIGNIETAQFLYQSLDYQALMERLAEKQEMVQYLQETGKTDRALKAAAELDDLEHQKEQLKENVFRLYETFTKIEINTERLVQAKAHFDQGEFREADAILNAADMTRDLNQLLERDQQLEREKAENDQHRTQLANEFLIKARLWATFYDEPNRFEQSCAYFEEALRAGRAPETVFEYAVFLQEHNSFDPATLLYAEALQMYRTLAAANPRTYLPDVAMTLLNLSLFYLQAVPDQEQSIALATEVLDIAQQFPQVPIVQHYAKQASQVLQANGVEVDA